ncbi:MAG: class I SAM-dependent methyltransferase [Acidobacteria bacterium]|nr:class I SAM-dependent methyltransferase [Acidobacteriota bacterium]
MDTQEFLYDSVPYPSFTFPQTHPDRLASIAAYYGLDAAPPYDCRVLELGCGDGTNLLSMAYALPASRFVGIDLSSVHIDDAKHAAGSLSLANIEFRQEDVVKLNTEELGEFDFIIAHGLYSWVPDFVREAVLTIYEECLASHGIGYISYNAYPGCYLRDMTRGMMRFHAGDVADPLEKVEHGKSVLRFVSEAAESDSIYQTMLKLELGQIEERSVQNVFHDDFADINQPFYLHEFVRQIEGKGLQYISDADPVAMNTGDLPAEARKSLNALGDDLIKREQYLDFVKCRRFRSSLICRSGLSLNRDQQPSILNGLLVASHVESEGSMDEIANPVPMKFIGPNGASLEINHPLTKASLIHLRSIWSRSIAFPELMIEAKRSLIGFDDSTFEDESERAAAFLIQLYGAGFVKFHKHTPNFAHGASEFPTASKFARWQISRGSKSVTTLSGLNLEPEFEAVRTLISLLDGTRDRTMLFNEMKEMFDVPSDQRSAFEAQLPEMIGSNLTKLAESGLLER